MLGLALRLGGSPASSGGGSGPTELAFADFENGVYRDNGSSAVAADFVSDPTKIEAGIGLKVRNGETPLLLLGGLFDAMTNYPVTVVVFVDLIDASDGALFFEVNNADDSLEMPWVSLGPGNSPGAGAYDAASNAGNLSSSGEIVTSTVNRLAITYSRSRIAASLNGADVVSVDVQDSHAQPSSIVGDPVQVILNAYLTTDTAYGTANVEKIVAYAPVADADLPGLSALT